MYVEQSGMKPFGASRGNLALSRGVDLLGDTQKTVQGQSRCWRSEAAWV